MPKSSNRIRVLRAERRLTQRELSRRARVTTTKISFIENGIVQATDDERKRLARVFGVDVTEAFPEAATA